jgi:two-component system nitrogen regulation sensor histidine kinase NtrY
MKRALLTALCGLSFMAVAFPLELRYMRLEIPSLGQKIVFLFLLNINIMALFTLIFFVGKSLVALQVERRQRVLGYRFKTKIIVVFVVLTSIPALLLFLVASGLGSNYIERLFTPQFREPIESSIELAKSIYDNERQATLEYARSIGKGIPERMHYKVMRMDAPPLDATQTIREAFSKKEGTEVISGTEGDTVRAAVSSGRGIIVVESFIPKEITGNIGKIQGAYENYLKLESLKTPLKLNYLLILGFFALNILFTALWVSMRIAKGITEPIQGLVKATEEVAAGDLSVRVKAESTDEIALLIDSFNRMVQELKEGKESLESAYQESDRRRLCMENILENIQSGVISLDEKGNVLTLNPAACRILNIRQSDVMGKYYEETITGIESGELRNFIKSINIKTLSAVERDVRAEMGGRKAILRVSVNSLRTEKGEYMGLLVVFDDLTDVIKAQKALAWQEVARRIAHEIKNPLTPIKLSTERLMKKWTEGDDDFNQVFERSTKTIIREVESLKRLVDEFSRFGKMPEIKKSPADIAKLIEEVIALYRDFKGIRLISDMPDVIPPVEVDGEQFKRVLINLFDNAVQAMDSKGSITISVALDAPSGRLFIDVADDGPGIKEEDKERLFLPYFSTKKDGTGLGLAIAQRIISEHSGYIRVRENAPKGSVFSIEIPLKES